MDLLTVTRERGEIKTTAYLVYSMTDYLFVVWLGRLVHVQVGVVYLDILSKVTFDV